MKIEIVYEDKDIFVIYKPSGIATQTNRLGEADVVSELKNHIFKSEKTNNEPYIGLIHRLDQPVEGLIVVAKNTESAKKMSQQLEKNELNKYYIALVYGELPENGKLQNWLIQDKRTNSSRVIPIQTNDARNAELNYKILEKGDNFTCVEVELITGRHHQIRVQFSASGHPLLGDIKYGTADSNTVSGDKKIKSVALCANELKFKHPTTGKEMKFQIEPRNF